MEFSQLQRLEAKPTDRPPPPKGHLPADTLSNIARTLLTELEGAGQPLPEGQSCRFEQLLGACCVAARLLLGVHERCHLPARAAQSPDPGGLPAGWEPGGVLPGE